MSGEEILLRVMDHGCSAPSRTFSKTDGLDSENLIPRKKWKPLPCGRGAVLFRSPVGNSASRDEKYGRDRLVD